MLTSQGRAGQARYRGSPAAAGAGAGVAPTPGPRRYSGGRKEEKALFSPSTRSAESAARACPGLDATREAGRRLRRGTVGKHRQPHPPRHAGALVSWRQGASAAAPGPSVE